MKWPERGGHSSENVLLTSAAGSQSPSIAQARTCLPPVCLTSPSAMNFPSGTKPVSSANSRCAASNGSSLSLYSPLGIVQAPKSFYAQNGPPGWTRKTSIWSSFRRNIRIPALCFMRLAGAASATYFHNSSTCLSHNRGDNNALRVAASVLHAAYLDVFSCKRHELGVLR